MQRLIRVAFSGQGRHRRALGISLLLTLVLGGWLWAELSPGEGNWTVSDIGAVGSSGTANYQAGTDELTVQGAGLGLGGTADSGAFYHLGSTFGGGLRGQLGDLPDGPGFAGLAVRDSANADAAGLAIGFDASGAAELVYRPTTGASAVSIALPGISDDDWLRLVVGDQVIYVWHADDGATWQSVGAFDVVLGASPLAGVVVASDSDTLVSATFDHLLSSDPELVVDQSEEAELSHVTLGNWTEQTAPSGVFLLGGDFLEAGPAGSGAAELQIDFEVFMPGTYELYLRWPADPGRDSNVPITVGSHTYHLDQTAGDNAWVKVGQFQFSPGDAESVLTISNTGTTGTVAFDALRVVRGAHYEPVQWKDFNRTEATDPTYPLDSGSGEFAGSKLTKVSGGNSFNADAVSTKRIEGDGGVQFGIENNGRHYYVGLSFSNDDDDGADLDYAFDFNDNGTYEIRELNTKVFDNNTAYGPNDRFEILRRGTDVSYWQNGELIYVSATASTTSLQVDVSIYHTNSTANITDVRYLGAVNTGDVDEDGLDDAWEFDVIDSDPNDAVDSLDDITPDGHLDNDGRTNQEEFVDGTNPLDGTDFANFRDVEWIDHEKTESSLPTPGFGSTLEKVSSNGAWNGDAISRRKFTGDGSFTFSFDQDNKKLYVGLAADNERRDEDEMLVSLYGNSNGELEIKEYTTTVWDVGQTYTASDVFRFEIEGNHIKVFQNGVELHDALIDSQDVGKDLHIDTAFYNTSSSISGVRADGSVKIGDVDEDELPDSWEQTIVDADPNDALVDIWGVLPGDDFDDDDRTNAEEYTDGSDPTDPASAFFFEDIVWTNLNRLDQTAGTGSGSKLTKNSSNGTWNGDGVGTKVIYGDGAIRFGFSQTGESYAIGFNASNDGSDEDDLDFFVLAKTTGEIEVWELGARAKDQASTYEAGDGFEIRREGTTITYWKNGALFYTSTNAASQTFLVDVSMKNTGCDLLGLRYRGAYDPGDPDNDGLTGAQEYQYGTDPGLADTDGDGLDDGDEVNVHGTNPTDDDHDNDGLKDGDEINIHNTSPTNDDSDGDELLDGAEVLTHGTRPDLPDTDGDGLDDKEEVVTYAALGVSANDPDSGDNDDGLNDRYEVWIISADTEDAYDSLASVLPGDDFDDDLISNLDEQIAGTDPTQAADADNDQMPDGWELFHGLDPNDPSDAGDDPDDDKLTNLEEYLLKDVYDASTDPNNPHSDGDAMDPDGDGVDDYWDHLLPGRSPLVAEDDDLSTDDDGIPDAWEIAKGLDPTDGSDGEKDYDYDRLTNFQEYEQGNDHVIATWSFVPTMTFDPNDSVYGRILDVNDAGEVAAVDQANGILFWQRSLQPNQAALIPGRAGYTYRGVKLNNRGTIAAWAREEATGRYEVEIHHRQNDGSWQLVDVLSDAADDVVLTDVTDSGFVVSYTLGSNESHTPHRWRNGQIDYSLETHPVRGADELGRIYSFSGSSDQVIRYNGLSWEVIASGRPQHVSRYGEALIDGGSSLPAPDATNRFYVWPDQASPVSSGQTLDGGLWIADTAVDLNAGGLAVFGKEDWEWDMPEGFIREFDGTLRFVTDLLTLYDGPESDPAHLDGLTTTLLDTNETGDVVGFAVDREGALEGYHNPNASGSTTYEMPILWRDGRLIIEGLANAEAGELIDGGRFIEITETGIIAVAGYRWEEIVDESDPQNPYSYYDEVPKHGILVPSGDNDGDGIPDDWEAFHGVDDPEGDPDDDGLTNREEYALGTVPSLPSGADTDGDGLNDGWEVAMGYDPTTPEDASVHDRDNDGLTDLEEHGHDTDPHLADSDNDALDDFEEVNVYSTDPTLADTDGDELDDGWEVLYGFDPTMPDDAANRNSDEDTLTDLDEYRYGTNPLERDTDLDGDDDGVEVQNETEPLDRFDFAADSDGDWLSDSWEMNLLGSLAASDGQGDFDSDGISDFFEFKSGLLPGQDDASGNLDGDQWTNLQEYLRGSDPEKADPPEPGPADLRVFTPLR